MINFFLNFFPNFNLILNLILKINLILFPNFILISIIILKINLNCLLFPNFSDHFSLLSHYYIFIIDQYLILYYYL